MLWELACASGQVGAQVMLMLSRHVLVQLIVC